jgi:hypothetical protein
MRVLVTIAHYFKQQPGADWYHALGSGRDPLAKIAGLNSEIVALHRYFGPHRATLDPRLRKYDTAGANVLDIVIMTVRGANVLQETGIDSSIYGVEYFEGPPSMLAFEAQRIMRERVGGYDLYAYLDDDLTIVDPQFFDKVLWFVETFGPDTMLIPTTYEMAHSGIPAKILFSPRLSSKSLASFRKLDLAPALTGRWNGREQTFRLPYNPHSHCFFVTDAQLREWITRPSFYDRDASFFDPLVSAATYAPGRVFGMYRPAEPDPWFLSIEHYGTRYSSALAPVGQTYGEPPLLSLAEKAASGGDGQAQALSNGRADTINSVIAEASRLRYQLEHLKSSRSELFRALVAAIRQKWTRRR